MNHEVWLGSPGSRALSIAAAVVCGLLMAPVAGAEEYGEPIVLGSLDPEVDRGFGTAVAIDGNTLAVGVPVSPEGGVVYIYERREDSPAGWELVAIRKGINPGEGEWFGYSLALDGETLVVGSPFEEARAYQSGAAYVFYRNRGGPSHWGRVRTLLPRNLGAFSHLGGSVSISGDLVAVGAPGRGSVYIFERHRPIRNWFGVHSELWGEITSPVLQDDYGGWPAEGFGYAVSLSGRTLTAGALYASSVVWPNPSESSLGIYIFDLVEDPETGEEEWSQLFNFESPALRQDGLQDDFGSILGLDGPILLAGGAESVATGCHIYERHHRGRNRWGYRTELRDSAVELHEVGGLDVRGKTAAVGARFRSLEPLAYGHGAIVYERHVPVRNSWAVAARLTSPDVSELARAVAIGPREVVTGHPETGVVQIFPRAPLVAADFEAGDTAGLSWATGNVEVISPGLGETAYALAVSVDGTDRRSMVRARQPHREANLSLGFDLAVNRVDLGVARVEIMNLYGPSRDLVRLTLEADPAVDQYWVRLAAWEQGEEGWRDVGRARMPPLRGVRMELEWRAATGPGHQNGVVRLYANGRLKAQALDLDTDRQFVNGLLLGLPKGSVGTAGGAFLLDEIGLHR